MNACDQTGASSTDPATPRVQEPLLRPIIDNANGIIWVKDLEGRFLIVNRNAEHVLGHPAERMIGRTVFDLYPREQAESYTANDRQVLASGRREEFQEEIQLTDGPHLFLSAKFPVRNGQGLVFGIGAICTDITTVKETEKALLQSEQRFRQMAATIKESFWLSLPDARTVLYVSPAFETIWGLSCDALYSNAQIWLDAIHPEDAPAVHTALEKLVTGIPFDIEYRIRRPDGEERWIGGRGYAQVDDQKRVTLISGVATDITARKRDEVALNAMRAQLQQAQKLESLGLLAGGVAHEINNPIMGIMNYAQLLMDDAPPTGPQREHAEGILRETERVATIVRDLLAFARQDSRQHSPALVPDIVKGTLSLVRAVMRNDQISIQLDLDQHLPPIECRSQQIQQVLMNLLTNARDALNQRFPAADPQKCIRLSAAPTEWHGGRAVRILVEDYGGGIPPHVLPHIFNPFFTTKPKEKGTGLGLSISHGIVKEHGGELRLVSADGPWTRFEIMLPAHGAA